MNLRNSVKQLLRMCGHAFVSTVHDHLNDVDRQLSQVTAQLGELRATADHLAAANRALLQGGMRTIEELVDRQLSQITSQLGELKSAVDDLAEAEGALLQGGIRTIEELKDVQTEFRRQDAVARQRIEEGEARWRETIGAWRSVREQNVQLIETFGDRLARSHQTLVDAAAQFQNNFSQFQNHLRPALEKQTEVVTRVQSQLADTSVLFENELVRQVSVESDDYEAVNIETGLLTFLYSHLPTRKALDVGAHVGDASDRLLRAGYEVYAFEPAPAVYKKLKQKPKGRKDFTAFQLALGSSEGEALLHLATDLSEAKYYKDPTLLSSLVTHSMPPEIPYTRTVPVSVKTISGLHRFKQ